MQLVPLSTVIEQIRVGQPLRWNIRNQDGFLLLARGIIVTTATLQSNLMNRGSFIDAAELEFNLAEVRYEDAPLEAFIGRWERLIALIRGFSAETDTPTLVERVHECLKHARALTELNTDLAIFLILRRDQSRLRHYGFSQSLHAAAVCGLAAQRLRWEPADQASVMSAALTMNLSIADLQGVLAAQREPLSAAQREQIRTHPADSAALLRHAGVSDEKWLAAVEQHHEVPGGTGYPAGLASPGELSQLLRYADIYAAQLSARATRAPQLAKQAARALFERDHASPLVTAVIKSFGLYPPGSYVRLASGETAIVTRRGASATTPVVVALTDTRGYPLVDPVLRETSEAAHAVLDAVPDEQVSARPAWQRLYEISFR
jgi:HD-GYP domain-containing protein (c-di-GMP phosphodiesterase class II)